MGRFNGARPLRSTTLGLPVGATRCAPQAHKERAQSPRDFRTSQDMTHPPPKGSDLTARGFMAHWPCARECVPSWWAGARLGPPVCPPLMTSVLCTESIEHTLGGERNQEKLSRRL